MIHRSRTSYDPAALNPSRFAVGFLMSLLASVVTLPAQTPSALAPDYERVAPKLPASTSKPSSMPAVPQAKADTKVVLQQLTGIVFVKSTAELGAVGGKVTGIQAKGFDLLDTDQFRSELAGFLGKPASMNDLQRICAAVQECYRKNDRPVVKVTLPAGVDITSGTVPVVVTEGHVGEVVAEGNRWFDSKMIESYVPLKRGDIIHATPLLREVNQLNSNPFRQTEFVLMSGKGTNEVDVVLKTQDRFPVRFFAGYEDSGNDLTADERLLTGFNWGNAFNLDHQMNYQFMGDSRFNLVRVHSGSYIIPFRWGDRLSFYGFRQEVKEDTDLTPLIDNRSEAWQASARYNYRLPDIRAYTHEVVVGLDFKQSHLTSIVGGVTTYNNMTDVAQAVLGYNASLQDGWGSTSFGGNAYYSPGKLTRHNKTVEFQNATAFTGADYYYARVSLQRNTRLPFDFDWILKGTYQISPSGNLLESERMGFGGYDSVRGYDERIASGDEGYIATTELRTPPVSFGSWCGFKGAPDRFQFLGFLDYGVAEKKLLRVGIDDPHVILWGVGPGIRYSVTPYFSVRADYGFQMKDLIESGFPSRHNSRWHIGVVFSY